MGARGQELGFEQAPGSAVMALDQARYIHSDQLAVFDDAAPADHEAVDLLRGAENQRGDRVVQPAGVGQAVQADGGEVGAFAGLPASPGRRARARQPRRAWPVRAPGVR